MLAAGVPPAGAGAAPAAGTASLAEALEHFERHLIQEALEAAGGNLAQAARRLDTDRANLHRRMRRLGMSRKDTGGSD
jgi:two-component system nitrogen regulation response regulator NtrX